MQARLLRIAWGLAPIRQMTPPRRAEAGNDLWASGKQGLLRRSMGKAEFRELLRLLLINVAEVLADVSIEEAAVDPRSKLGQILRNITPPVISPAFLSGWLLAFTISLDDVIILNFVTGPGNTTR